MKYAIKWMNTGMFSWTRWHGSCYAKGGGPKRGNKISENI